jgi:hypothetical protein
MLQRIEDTRHSIAEAMIQNFSKDDGLKESLNFLDCAISSIEHNHEHLEELALLRIAKLAIREKVLLLAYV